MVFKKVWLFSFVTMFSFCHGQEKSNTANPTVDYKSLPKIIKNFEAVPLAPDFDTALVSQYIRSIFQDSKGNLWFGTLGEGVVRYDVNSVTYFSHPDGFYSHSVQAIDEDQNGNLWFGTDQGVYKYDGKTFRNYNHKDGLSHTDISRKSILVDRSGVIWVGTQGGLYRYDPWADSVGGQSFSLFREFPPIHVAGIMEDTDGNIWFASSDKGVFRYDGKTMTNIAEKEGLGDNYAGGMAQDKAGHLWFIMKNGIVKYDGKSFIEYTSADVLGGSEFWGIYIEESGIIWITARGSTTRFDPALPLPISEAFTVYTADNGFTCCVQSMYQDKSGNMWWGTGQGLYRFDGHSFYQVKKNGPWQ